MNTNTKPFTLFVHGRACILANKKGNVLFTFPDMLFEVKGKDMQELLNTYTTEALLTGFVVKFFTDQVTKAFIQKLRTEPELRRQVGGTQWTTSLTSDTVTMHLNATDVDELYKKVIAKSLAGLPTYALFDDNLDNILVAIEKHIALQPEPSNA